MIIATIMDVVRESGIICFILIVNIIFLGGTRCVLGGKNISRTLIELVTSFSKKKKILINLEKKIQLWEF